MNKIIATIIILLVFSGAFCQDSIKKKKILIVATNIDVVGKNENGTFLIEIAYPFQYFIDSGYDVDIMTPKGGYAPTYPKEYAGPGLGKIQRSELFVSKTNNSISPNNINDTGYVAVFYPGGYGQFFDVVTDERISLVVAKIYERGGVVGTTGHGTASLVNIKLRNSKYLVDGKRMTCFPHWMEIQKMWQADYGKLLPFDMQDVLLKRGSNLTVCADGLETNNKCTQVTDNENRMVTGAFANDALWVAEEIIKLLNKTTK